MISIRPAASGSSDTVRNEHECLYADTTASATTESNSLSSNNAPTPNLSDPPVANPCNSDRSDNDRTASSGHPIIAVTPPRIFSGIAILKSFNRLRAS